MKYFLKTSRDKHVPETLFKEAAGLGMQISQEETPALVVSCAFCEFFKKTHFAEHLRTMKITRI